MEMHQIRYFLAVCETLNFTRAAENCNVTQPALTRAIQKLEDELGGLLFRRERHLTHLTDLGRLMRPQLEQVSFGRGAELGAQPRAPGEQCRWATACTVSPRANVSATSRRFSSSDQRRRACPRKISTRAIRPPPGLALQRVGRPVAAAILASFTSHARPPPPDGYP